MEVKIFDKNNTSTQGKSGKRFVSANMATGYFFFAKAAVDSLNLTIRGRIIFAQDKQDKKQWYLSKATSQDPDAFELKSTKNGTLYFQSKGMAKELLSGLKADTLRFLISKNSVRDKQDRELYQLIPIESK